MNTAATTSASQPALPLILIAATLQGVALWFLFGAQLDGSWPAGYPGLHAALMTLAVFLVPTIYALADWSQRLPMWMAVAGASIVLAVVGYHTGANALPANDLSYRREPFDFVHFLATFMLMFHAVPFVQCALEHGRLTFPYTRLFEYAWRNALRLALAALFAGVTWLLLWTAAKLFEMLGINFLMVVLFDEGRFFWIPLALAFGTGVYFAENSERLMLAARSLVLSLLKWLAAAAALILVLFSIALLFKTPTLLVTKQHVISATWLLWLAALNIYLYNAGFQDGSETSPYPRLLGRLLRFAMPLLLLVGVLAMYALLVRVSSYGLTVPRVWGLLISTLVLLYATGYVWAARRAAPWMGGMARTNTWVAGSLVAVLLLMLTPALAPQRLAAASLESHLLAAGAKPDVNALRMLKNDTGRYGLTRLQSLADKNNGAVNGVLRTAAAAALKSEFGNITLSRIAATVFIDAHSGDATAGPTVDDALRAAIAAWPRVGNDESVCTATVPCPALLVDLDADGSNELVLYAARSWALFSLENGTWKTTPLYQFQCLTGRSGICNNQDVGARMKAGDFALLHPKRTDLRVGSTRIEIPEP